MNIKKIATLVTLALMGISSSAISATWRVELDGSGDFTVIQDAVEAAAAGDTIQIGPGRFDTFRPFSAPAWTEDTIVGITKDNLTFIGSGSEVTFIGTDAPYSPYWDDPKCFCSIDGYDGTIKDLTIENVETGIYWYRGHLEVVNCYFRGEGNTYNAMGAWCDGGMLIENCDFSLGGPLSHGISTWFPAANSVVRNCRFWGGGNGFGCGGSTGDILESCTFSSLRTGITFDSGSSGLIRDCQFQIFDRYAIAATYNSDIQLNDCYIDGATQGIQVGGGSSLTGSSNVIANTSEEGFWIWNESIVTLHESHILPSSGLAVRCMGHFSNSIIQDFSYNFWGTTDLEYLGSLIEDGNDDPSIQTIVNFLPIADGPVSTENMTLDGVKALYR